MKQKTRRGLKQFFSDTVESVKEKLLKNSPNLLKIVIDVLVVRITISLVGMSNKKGSYVWDIRVYVFKKLLIGTNLGKSE